jgi:hypothetical protein
MGEVPGYYQGVETAIRLTRDVRASAKPGHASPPEARRQRGASSLKSNS